MTRIKICGVTRVEDARLCEELGVDFVGLNMVRSSPRCISLDRAKLLRSFLRQAMPVLIVEDEEPSRSFEIARSLGCSRVQMYSTAAPTFDCGSAANNAPVGEKYFSPTGALFAACPGAIAAFRSLPPLAVLTSFLTRGMAVLLDGMRNGVMADVDAIAEFPADIRSSLFIAGGLTANNVRAIIDRLQPFAVDVASGVEREPGVKDPAKLRAFVDAVRIASAPIQ